MSVLFALFTSHPPLMACELGRLASRVSLVEHVADTDAGVGWHTSEALLLRRYSQGAPPSATSLLLPPAWQGSGSLLYHSGPVPHGLSVDDNGQPLRSRGWLYAQAGSTWPLGRMESRLREFWPALDFQQLRGQTDAEAALALFHAQRRVECRGDDLAVDARLSARLLGRAGRILERCRAEPRGRGTSWVALHPQALLAARGDGVPLYYALLEGTDLCSRCGLDGRLAHEALRTMHRALRTVAVSSHPMKDSGFAELLPGQALAVDAMLNVAQLAI